eukprot:7186268-Pyramimonas_sp.AAC.1
MMMMMTAPQNDAGRQGGVPGSPNEHTTAMPAHTWPPTSEQPIQERTKMATPPDVSPASVAVAGECVVARHGGDSRR